MNLDVGFEEEWCVCTAYGYENGESGRGKETGHKEYIRTIRGHWKTRWRVKKGLSTLLEFLTRFLHVLSPCTQSEILDLWSAHQLLDVLFKSLHAALIPTLNCRAWLQYS